MKWEGHIDTGPAAFDPLDNAPLTKPSTWVPNLPEKRANPVAYPVIDGVSQHSDGRALEAQPSIIETATPFWRAVAQVVRTIAPALIITAMLLLAALITGADEWTAAGILVFGSILVAAFWIITDKLERRDSAAGIEHHKIDAATELRLQELADKKETQDKLVDSYLKKLSG